MGQGEKGARVWLPFVVSQWRVDVAWIVITAKLPGISDGPILCSCFPHTDACALQNRQRACDIFAPHTAHNLHESSAVTVV
jgi:hypothetical protein